MWKADKKGVEFSRPEEAYEALRNRAQALLDESRLRGRDVSQHRMRLCDEAGNILFSGTLIEAAYLRFGSDHTPASKFRGRDAITEPDHGLPKARAPNASFVKAERHLAALCAGLNGVRYRMNADWSELRSLPKNSLIPATRKARPNWLELYVPQVERALVMDCARNAIQTKAEFQLLHRVVRLDGSIGWLQSHAVPVFRQNGDILEWLGAGFDVTAECQAFSPR